MMHYFVMIYNANTFTHTERQKERKKKAIKERKKKCLKKRERGKEKKGI